MIRRRKLRILQVHHAMYVSHLLTRGFRALGHRADSVYFNFGGPSSHLTWDCDVNLPGSPKSLLRHLGFLAYAMTRYDIFHFWSRPYLVPAFFYGTYKHLPLDLALLKKAGKIISFQSDGCWPMVRPSVWKAQIDPEICHVCQATQGDLYGSCSNDNTVRFNQAMERYADVRFGIGLGLDFEAQAEFVFLPVDLEQWQPGLAIPPEHVYQRQQPGSLLIYHGVGSERPGSRGNIKGSHWIRETVRDLQHDGYNVELMYIEGVPNRVVRFYQAQADIVVDQLLIGGGGANARECLALGKPVLTRVHPQQLDAWDRAGYGRDRVPFFNTDRHTLKANLIRLIEEPSLRAAIGERSAAFAREALSPVASACSYLEHFELAAGRARRRASPAGRARMCEPTPMTVAGAGRKKGSPIP